MFKSQCFSSAMFTMHSCSYLYYCSIIISFTGVHHFWSIHDSTCSSAQETAFAPCNFFLERAKKETNEGIYSVVFAPSLSMKDRSLSYLNPLSLSPVQFMLQLSKDATVEQLKDQIYQKTRVHPRDVSTAWISSLLSVYLLKTHLCLAAQSFWSAQTPCTLILWQRLQTDQCARNTWCLCVSRCHQLWLILSLSCIYKHFHNSWMLCSYRFETLSEKLAGEPVVELCVLQRTHIPITVPSRCSCCHRDCSPEMKLKRCSKCYKTAYCDKWVTWFFTSAWNPTDSAPSCLLAGNARVRTGRVINPCASRSLSSLVSPSWSVCQSPRPPTHSSVRCLRSRPGQNLPCDNPQILGWHPDLYPFNPFQLLRRCVPASSQYNPHQSRDSCLPKLSHRLLGC